MAVPRFVLNALDPTKSLMNRLSFSWFTNENQNHKEVMEDVQSWWSCHWKLIAQPELLPVHQADLPEPGKWPKGFYVRKNNPAICSLSLLNK